jgi:hypothetical protein
MSLYKKNELVKVTRHRTRIKSNSTNSIWEKYLIVAMIINDLGKIKMRTGLSRIETLDCYEVLIEGKIIKVPERAIKKLYE